MDTIGYYNEELKKKKQKALEAIISTNVQTGKNSTVDMRKYLDHRDWLGYQGYALLCSSFTQRTITVPKEVVALKKELIQKYKKI